MAYSVNKKDGTLLVTVADGAVDDTQTTIKLFGRGITNYGEIMAENLVWMMEHFANTTAPAQPLEGQLWFDTGDSKMMVRSNGVWRPIGSVLVASPTPPGGQEGDLWWDQDNDKLYGWDDDGGSWVLVGPITADPSIAQDAAMIGINLNPGPGQMILVIVNGIVVAGWADQAYTPVDYAGNVGTINVGGTNISVNVPASFPAGVTAGCTLSPIVSGNVFNGTAITAQYADLAERFASNRALEPGDVVRLCDHGDHEVELTDDAVDQNVFGVVSTQPAVMMNSMAGPDETHPYIALSGRVPVKVIGAVKKGQRLVSSSIPGIARAAYDFELDKLHAIFGRALVSKDEEEIGLVEAVVGVK